MFNEEILEKITMEILEELEYECINGYEMERTDFSKVILEDDLIESIRKINSNVNEEQLTEVIRLVKNLEHNNTILNNKQFTKYLLEGCQVPINENGETRYKTIKIVDFNNISNNTFKAINQYTIIEHSEKRPDIIIFVNGLPLVVVELKSTVREDVKSGEKIKACFDNNKLHFFDIDTTRRIRAEEYVGLPKEEAEEEEEE